MPDPTVSDAMKEAYALAPAEEVILHTIELRHPTFVDDDGNPDSIWVVRNDVDIAATIEPAAPVKGGEVVTFIGLPFKFMLPPIDGSGTPSIDVSLDAVDREIVENLDRAAEEPTKIVMVYRAYLASDLSGPETLPPPSFELSNVKVGTVTITAQARLDLDLGGSFPRKVYRAAEFPGLVGQ